MVDFVFNSASVPLSNKAAAQNTADDVFYALSQYVGDNSKPKLFFDAYSDAVLLAVDFSLQDYSDDLLVRNRELADFMSEFSEYFETIEDTSEFSRMKLKVGDDTRFSNVLSVKYACMNSAVLVSIAEEHIWQREKIQFWLIDDGKAGYELYNLFSSNYSYLPIELPPFSLSDKSRFRRTRFLHEKQAVYQEIKTGYYWYNDFFHRDNKAHFEVFDRTGSHIAEASMAGVLDCSKADKNKHIEVN